MRRKSSRTRAALLVDAPMKPEQLPNIDEWVSEAFDKYGIRGDEHLAHLGGDVAGLCDRETWARRHGYPIAKIDTETALTWQLGHNVEATLLDAIEKSAAVDGWTLQRNIIVGLTVANGALHKMPLMTDVDTSTLPTSFKYCVGHLDAVLRRDGYAFVLDTKSTVWYSKFRAGGLIWEPKEVRESQCIQVAAYCLALPDEPRYGALYELDLGSKQRRTHWVDSYDYRDLILERVQQVLERTGGKNEPVDVGPNPWTMLKSGDSWACGYEKIVGGDVVIKPGYCRNTSCPRLLRAK